VGHLHALGYGQKPQIQFPGAVTGGCALEDLAPVEQATMAYGYGLSASLFQMAHSYTAFAHDGQIIPVTMLKSRAPVGVRVFSPGERACRAPMLQMAAAPGGTGPLAQTVGYSVGGKSGTAHKQVGKGYASNKYRAWFTGMAPIEAAHHRRGDDRRAQRRQLLRRRGRRARVQRGRAADAAHDGRAARHERQAADHHAGRGGVVLSTQLHTPEAAGWLRERVQVQPACDSRPWPGDGFIAWPGAATDGRKFVGAALAQGATACLVEQGREPSASRTTRSPNTRPQGRDRPHRRGLFTKSRRQLLDVLAVTGTNGKTSTAWWLAQALSGRLGRKCGLIGTLGIGEPAPWTPPA
jgi:membrane peptidoglycan carboxypeptidase